MSTNGYIFYRNYNIEELEKASLGNSTKPIRVSKGSSINLLSESELELPSSTPIIVVIGFEQDLEVGPNKPLAMQRFRRRESKLDVDP
jgi:hypothetical protein